MGRILVGIDPVDGQEMCTLTVILICTLANSCNFVVNLILNTVTYEGNKVGNYLFHAKFRQTTL